MCVEVEGVAGVEKLTSFSVDLLVRAQYAKVAFDAWIVHAVVGGLHASRSEAISSNAVTTLGMLRLLPMAWLIDGRLDCSYMERWVLQLLLRCSVGTKLLPVVVKIVLGARRHFHVGRQ